MAVISDTPGVIPNIHGSWQPPFPLINSSITLFVFSSEISGKGVKVGRWVGVTVWVRVGVYVVVWVGVGVGVGNGVDVTVGVKVDAGVVVSAKVAIDVGVATVRLHEPEPMSAAMAMLANR